MTDLIVSGGEVSESVVNRQSAKIQYLQQENQQLLEQNKDLERALMLNKDVLRLAFESQKSTNNSNDTTNTSAENQGKTILQKLHDENVHLTHQLRKMTDERNLAQNRVLLQQQIAEENQAFYKDMISDLEEKVGELRRGIQDKEYAIQEIEKSRATSDDGQMVKIREIVTPNEQTLRLHEELESTRQILNKISTESQSLTEQNNLLKEINFNFKREIIKLRVVLRSQVAFYKMKGFKIEQDLEFIYEDQYGNTDDNLELQNEIYLNPGYILDDYGTDAQQQVPNPPDVLTQYGYQQPQNPQQLRILSNNERAIYQDKIQKSESLLKGFKELFEKEKNKTQLLASKLSEVQRNYLNLEETNYTLIKANKMKDERIKKLQGEVSYYRKQYGNYMNLLKNKRDINLNLSFEKQKYRPTFEQTKQDFKARILGYGAAHTQQNSEVKREIIPTLSEQKQSPKDVTPPKNFEDGLDEKIEVNVSILDNGDNDGNVTPLGEVSNNGNDQEGDGENDNDGDSQDQDSVHPLEVRKRPKGKGLNIEIEDDDYFFNSHTKTATTRNKQAESNKKQTQSQYQMTIIECKQFLLNSAKELYLTYNLRMNNLQRKQLLDHNFGDAWKPQIPIWHQKSSSDPLDYFTLNFQDLELKNNSKRQHKPDDNQFNKKLKAKNAQKQKEKKLFNVDMSLIQDKKASQHQKKITIDISFISNDNENILEDMNQ